MKKWLVIALVLTLSGVLLGADLGLAQGRGGGSRGPGSQCPMGWGQGQGPGYQDCPNYPGYRNCPQGRGYDAQGTWQGPRSSRRAWQQSNPPATQTNPPVVTQ